MILRWDDHDIVAGVVHLGIVGLQVTRLMHKTPLIALASDPPAAHQTSAGLPRPGALLLMAADTELQRG